MVALVLATTACSSGSQESVPSTSLLTSTSSTTTTTTATTTIVRLGDEGQITLSADEQALADELARILEATPVPENFEARGDPQCVAEVWVAGLGLETLEEAGISVGNVDMTSLAAMLSLGSPEEIESIQLTVGVLCARDVFVASFVEQLGVSRSSAECVVDTLLADPSLRLGFLDPRLFEDPAYQQAFIEVVTGCS